MCLSQSGIPTEILQKLPTPCYVYSERSIVEAYKRLTQMDSAYGIEVKYAMKANSNRTILKIIKEVGGKIDASSFNEAKRAIMAGFKPCHITYTTQEIMEQTEELFSLVREGMKFNVCSLRQYDLIRKLAMQHNIALSVRIHPGSGSGESITRDTGSNYSCFGVHLNDIEKLISQANQDKVCFDEIHIHIGSGGNKEKWLKNVRDQLQYARKYFKNLKKIDFGGGLKTARMPEEKQLQINLKDIEQEMKSQVLRYGEETNTKPKTVIQPGTYLVANSGYILTKVIDIKSTVGFQFVLVNGGMELNTRPLLYGSKHPFYIVSQGKLISSQFDLKEHYKQYAVVGRCCQSGDSQSLDEMTKMIVPRKMNRPKIGDLLIIGGAGAYCSSMSPFNYNSHVQAPQFLFTMDKQLRIIRKVQTLDQIVQNQTDELF